MSPLASLLSRGKEEQDASTDVSDLPAPALTVIARVNLLPPEIAEAERFRREQVARGLVLVGAAAVVVVGVVAASGGVTKAQEEVDAADAQSRVLQSQIVALAEVPATAQALATAEAQRTAALGQEVRWSQYLNGLGLETGDLNTQIETMTVTQNLDGAPAGGGAAGTGASTSFTGQPGIATVTYGGVAKAPSDVALFLDALARQKNNIDPNFTALTTAYDDEVKADKTTFAASVTVGSGAESGRYTNSGG